MKEFFDLALETNLPYYMRRFKKGWAFYNRGFRHTISGLEHSEKENPEVVTIPLPKLRKIFPKYDDLFFKTEGSDIQLHDGTLTPNNNNEYFNTIFELIRAGVNPIHQKWFSKINKESSNIADSTLELPATSL